MCITESCGAQVHDRGAFGLGTQAHVGPTRGRESLSGLLSEPRVTVSELLYSDTDSFGRWVEVPEYPPPWLHYPYYYARGGCPRKFGFKMENNLAILCGSPHARSHLRIEKGNQDSLPPFNFTDSRTMKRWCYDNTFKKEILRTI